MGLRMQPRNDKLRTLFKGRLERRRERRHAQGVPAARGAGSWLVIVDRMACGCRESALSLGQVGDYCEVVGWPHAVDRCITG
jgi:hypothetical protein